jgi:hypothetical protein
VSGVSIWRTLFLGAGGRNVKAAPVLAQPAGRAPSLMWINSAASNSSDFIKIMLGLKVQDVIGSVMLWSAFVLAVVVLFYMEMKR